MDVSQTGSAVDMPAHSDAGTHSDFRLELDAPITSDVILEVRSGKMKPMQGIKVLSGIDKTLCAGRVPVTYTGITGDEHDSTFHGGLDKAVHGYCKAHYDLWKREFPSAAERFRPGGFGENLVFARLNECNVNIGDIFVVKPRGGAAPGDENGDDDKTGLLLQVSLPRQPCFKLNHRFGLKNFAPQTTKLSRTGWYFRVLREGTVQAGDELRLVERRQPDWPLERVQEYLHRRRDGDGADDTLAMVAQLAEIPEFGAECRDAFRSRLAKQEARARREQRRMRELQDAAAEWRPFRVVERKQQTPRIVSLVLALEGDQEGEGCDETQVPDGAHVRLRLPPPPSQPSADSAVAAPVSEPLVRTYSVVGGNARRFEIAVALADDSAAVPSGGGSRYLHESAVIGSHLQVGRFAAGVPLVTAASHHVYVAGGVGITAFLAQIEAMHAIHYSCELHYAVRSAADIAYAERLARLNSGSAVVHIYDKQQGQRLDLGRVVRNLPWNARISFCGPPRLMEEALRETRAVGLGADQVHWEAFSAETTGEPFEAVVRRIGSSKEETSLHVGPDDTLLEVLQRQFGVDAVPSSCEVGNCGTCAIAVRQGQIEHRGMALTPKERARGDTMLSCVSRGVGRLVVEI